MPFTEFVYCISTHKIIIVRLFESTLSLKSLRWIVLQKVTIVQNYLYSKTQNITLRATLWFVRCLFLPNLNDVER